MPDGGCTFFTPEEESRRVMRQEAPKCLFIYGAGLLGRELFSFFATPGDKVKIRGFIDDNPHNVGRVIEGIPVMSLADLWANHNDCIVVAAPPVAQAKMMARCHEAGMRNVVSSQEFLRTYTPTVIARASSREICDGAKEALTLWRDSDSANMYRRLVRYRFTHEPEELPGATYPQYFVPHIVPKERLLSLVDAGAFDGDTLREFRRVTGDKFNAYYAFEPQAMMYSRLLEEGNGDSRVHAYAIALGRKAAVMRFRSTDDSRSHVTEDGDEEVRVDTLDAILADKSVTMLKMDIEGAEEGALAGAENLIRKQRPLLAICTYHKIEHLWEIPLWIHRLGLGYELVMGHHSETHSESVCYAI